jgi:phosphatidylserine/phosphatidylglycerophosphate/cardiolipin synthase-like enzyme
MPVVADAGDVEDLASASPLKVSFNNTYLERIDLNMPIAKRDPKNTDKGLIKLIRGAKASLDGAFYDIEDPGVVAEMIKAKKRGVQIRLVTDTDNLVEKSDPSKPRAAIEQLKAADVPVVDDKRSAIMHHKFMVVDGQAVWTGSTNLTPTSLYAHNNNALILKSSQLADAYTTEFERLFIKKEFGASVRQDVKPVKPIRIGSSTVRVFFSPRGGGREAVVNELKQAKSRIRFMTFSLTDHETGDTILAKAKAGVKVEGVFDRWLAAGQYSLFDTFKGVAGVEVCKDGNEALMHHKVIVIDNTTVITGSYNYSENAEANNNEAFLIIEHAGALNAAYSKEFDRLEYASKHNHPPVTKRPDPEKKAADQP